MLEVLVQFLCRSNIYLQLNAVRPYKYVSLTVINAMMT